MKSSGSRPWFMGLSSAMLLSLASVAAFAAPADAAPAAQQFLPAQANLTSPKTLAQSQKIGDVANTSHWSFGLVLPSKNPTGLTQYAQAVSNPTARDYHHFLTHAQMIADYGPSATLVHQLTQYLQQQRFTVRFQGQMLQVSGTVAQVNRLFSTRLAHFSRHHHPFAAPSGAIHIPAVLRQAEGVTGLVVNAVLPALPSHLLPADKMPMVHYAPRSRMQPTPAGHTSTQTTNGMTVSARLLSNGPRTPGMAVRYLISVTKNGMPDTSAQFDALSGPYLGANFPVDTSVTNSAGQFLIDFTVSVPQQLSLALTATDSSGSTATVQLPMATFHGPNAATAPASSLFGPTAKGAIIAPWNPASNSVVSALNGQALEQQTSVHGPAHFAVFTAGQVASASTLDVKQFAQKFGLPTPHVQVAYTGPNACSSSNSSCAPYLFGYQAELSLDMQMMETAAPGSQIQVYEAGSLRSALNQVVSQDRAQVFSLSYGTGELVELAFAPGAQATWDTLAQEATVEGITISVSAGDSGAFEGAQSGFLTPMPSYPANSPYVSSLGGTEVSVNPTGQINQTAMWGGNIGSEMSTLNLLSFLSQQNMIAGGGYSILEPAPAYQSGYVPLGYGRGNPDFSLPASVVTPGYFVYIGGTPYYVGGTSASAPLFAGFMGDLGLALHSRLGNVNPVIYQLYAKDPALMMEISYGNNGVYSVTPGAYNAAAGLGQINMGRLYQDAVPSGPAPGSHPKSGRGPKSNL